MNNVEVHVIRDDAKASHYEIQINKASSIKKCSTLILDFHRLSVRKGEELIRSRFWLGGAVKKAHSLAKPGDSIMHRLSQDTGLSAKRLTDCLNLWDMVKGDVVKLQSILDRIVERDGKVLWVDFENIIRANREAIKENKRLRIARDRAAAIMEETPGAQLLPDALTGGTTDIKIPDAPTLPQRIRKRVYMRSIRSACNELLDRPEDSVIIQEIETDKGIFNVHIMISPSGVS